MTLALKMGSQITPMPPVTPRQCSVFLYGGQMHTGAAARGDQEGGGSSPRNGRSCVAGLQSTWANVRWPFWNVLFTSPRSRPHSEGIPGALEGNGSWVSHFPWVTLMQTPCWRNVRLHRVLFKPPDLLERPLEVGFAQEEA